MNPTLADEVESWEDEGGAPPVPIVTLQGSESQVEWAERIKAEVNIEFDRVAAAFRAIGTKQGESKRVETEAIIAILEAKRVEVMSNTRAGYFIHDWQEITDQVRRMIFDDARYQEIKNSRTKG